MSRHVDNSIFYSDEDSDTDEYSSESESFYSDITTSDYSSKKRRILNSNITVSTPNSNSHKRICMNQRQTNTQLLPITPFKTTNRDYNNENISDNNKSSDFDESISSSAVHNSGSFQEMLQKNLKMLQSCRIRPQCYKSCTDNCKLTFTLGECDILRNEFWNLNSVSDACQYIVRHMETIQIRKKPKNLKGSSQFTFHLFKNNEKINVCKKFLMETLGVSANMIQCAWTKIKNK